MDFAPYQSSPPEHARVASPDYSSPRPSTDSFRRPSLQHPQPQRSSVWGNLDGAWPHITGGSSNDASPAVPGAFPAPVAEVSEWDTSLGLRLDYEACLAYLAFPPIGAIILLILERNSDFVRFHAWQSALLFTTLMLFHLLISWSRFLSWIFFLGDLVLIGFLTLRAYKDAEILDRFEVPFFGRIASRFVDDE